MDGAREALAYLSATATLMFVLHWHGDALDAAEAALVADTCERLMTEEPASVAGWGDLARLARLLEHALADVAHPLAELVAELHRDLLQRRDAAEREPSR